MPAQTAKTKKKKLFHFLLTPALGAALALPFLAALSCPAHGADKAPVQNTALQKTGQGQLQNTPQPQKNPEDETYTYQSGGRRDPFLSLIYTAQQAQKKKSVLGRPPLEQYAVSDFMLEAVVTRAGLPSYALVRLPNGKDYILNVGAKVGINGGRVTKIGRDYIVVRETTADFKGRRSAHKIILKLRKQEE